MTDKYLDAIHTICEDDDGSKIFAAVATLAKYLVVRSGKTIEEVLSDLHEVMMIEEETR